FSRQFPSLPIFPCKIFIRLCHIFDLRVGGIKQQSFAPRPQRNGRQAECIRYRTTPQKISIRRFAALHRLTPHGNAVRPLPPPFPLTSDCTPAAPDDPRALASESGNDLAFVSDKHHPFLLQLLSLIKFLRCSRLHRTVVPKQIERWTSSLRR